MELGELYVVNTVTTYWLREDGVSNEARTNLISIALEVQSKYDPDVFPATVSKARVRVRDVPDPEFSSDSIYPIQKKRRLDSGAEAVEGGTKKSKTAARNKLAKQLAQLAKASVTQQYIRVTNSIFATGRTVVAGGKSVVCNKLMAALCTRRLSHQLQRELRPCNTRTENIVCHSNLGYRLNINWMKKVGDAKGYRIAWCPEEFTGFGWMIETTAFVIFSSGKIVATGIKAPEGVAVAKALMHEYIAPFREGDEPADFNAVDSGMRDAKTLTAVPPRRERKPRKLNPAGKRAKRIDNGLKKMLQMCGVQSVEELQQLTGADQ